MPMKPEDVTYEMVDRVEFVVGMGNGAWDVVCPKEIIAAAVNAVEACQPKYVSDKGYFAYSCEDYFQEFDTEQQAREAAEKFLDGYRDAAHCDLEWHDEVETVCFGKIIQRAAKTDVVTADEEEDQTGARPDWEYSCDYKLRNVHQAEIEQSEM